jgi:hypothetical protein
MGFLEVIAHAKIRPPRKEIWLLTTAGHDHSSSRDEDQQLRSSVDGRPLRERDPTILAVPDLD